jgi:hypothetical protein
MAVLLAIGDLNNLSGNLCKGSINERIFGPLIVLLAGIVPF